MKIAAVVSCWLVALFTLSRGLGEIPDTPGLVFSCTLSSTGKRVPFMFDTLSDIKSPFTIARQAYDLIGQILSNAVWHKAEAEFDATEDFCVLESTGTDLMMPVTVMSAGPATFAICAMAQGSPFYSMFESFGVESYPGLGTDYVMEVESKSVMGDYGCDLDNFMSADSGEGWTLDIESLGTVNKTTYAIFEDSGLVKARLSSLDEGISLPRSIWSAFLSNFPTPNFDSGKLYFDDCDEAEDLVIVLSNQQGYGIRIPPMKIKGQCILAVSPNDGNEVILGAPFFKSGFVQINRSGSVELCPARQHHISDPAFDLTIPELDRPRPRYLPARVMPRIPGANENDPQYGLWIGLTIGGFCLFLSITICLVCRSKRKQAKERLAIPVSPRPFVLMDTSVASVCSSEEPRSTFV